MRLNEVAATEQLSDKGELLTVVASEVNSYAWYWHIINKMINSNRPFCYYRMSNFIAFFGRIIWCWRTASIFSYSRPYYIFIFKDIIIVRRCNLWFVWCTKSWPSTIYLGFLDTFYYICNYYRCQSVTWDKVQTKIWLPRHCLIYYNNSFKKVLAYQFINEEKRILYSNIN